MTALVAALKSIRLAPRPKKVLKKIAQDQIAMLMKIKEMQATLDGEEGWFLQCTRKDKTNADPSVPDKD